ncbi:MAG TPA: DCC1-like thiol-disulfide oxidoreductase family protein [Thermoleophilaceae bacterium]|nr:DCC1-like thiol-disulfide oxidoreductase family protein [Thermoleophilaceae bacterium]
MENPIILYDRDCGLCRTSLALILAWDRNERLRPVALQDPEAERLLADLTPQERMASWHLVGADGSVRSAGDALEVLFDLLPHGDGPSAVARRFPAAAGQAYRWVADHRSELGRLVPSPVKQKADAYLRKRA